MNLVFRTLTWALVAAWGQDVLLGQVYINEIFLDPPSSGDTSQEYVELRGTPGMSLDNYYLLFLENENNSLNLGAPGEVEFLFDLQGQQLGSNGFLLFRQKGSPYTSIGAGASDRVNLGSATGWGTNPNNNTLGVASAGGVIENSGFTAMLINAGNGVVPELGMKLDSLVDNDDDPDTMYDGLDDPNGQPGWSISDSIGVFGEIAEVEFGRTYAPINFGPELSGQIVSYVEASTGLPITNHVVKPNLSPGQAYVGVGTEIEYIGRYGNSTGSGEHDWLAANLTNNSLAGFVGVANGFHMSGTDPHGFPREPQAGTTYGGLAFPKGYMPSESSQFIPYGTSVNSTLGSANYPLNQTRLPWDFSGNGAVDMADFTVWRDSIGQIDPTSATQPLVANADRSGKVDAGDYDAWSYHFGESLQATSDVAPPFGLQFSVLPLGENDQGNREWRVTVTPDASLFANGVNGLGGSLATEIGLTVSGGAIVSAAKNGVQWPTDNPGQNPFSHSHTQGIWTDAQHVFASLGSVFFTQGQPVELFTLVTSGTLPTSLSWSNVRIAQSGVNFGGFQGTASSGVPGDLNGDDGVDAADAGIMFGLWGENPQAIADFNRDGLVDAADAGIMFANWTGDSQSTVPEPHAGMGLWVGTMLLVRRFV